MSSTALLLPSPLERYWTEHSERNFLDSLAAVLGVHRSQRSFIGRWAASTTDDYVRTARHIVNNIQNSVAENLRN